MIRMMTIFDAMAVTVNMRDIDRRELSAVSGISDPDRVREEMFLQALEATGESRAAVLNGKPVCIFGVTDAGVVWMWATDEFPAVRVEVTRYLMKEGREIGKRFGPLKCLSAAFHTESHKWLEMLGLRKQGEYRTPGNAIFYEYGVNYAR